VIRQ